MREASSSAICGLLKRQNNTVTGRDFRMLGMEPPNSASRLLPVLLDRLTRWVLVAVIIAMSVLVLQKSLHFVAVRPPINVDDSEGNVSLSFEKYGRYGFLASPTQGLYEVDRTHAFFNYGPLYFYVGAALVWLFGPSVGLFRMIHPIGLFFIVILFLWTFRKTSLIGTALFAVSIYKMYLWSQWPLGRPDIMVSICIAAMLLCSARAIDRGSWSSWIGVGFFASSAATTHLIALGIIPAAGIIWLLSVIPEVHSGKKQAVKSLSALVLGGVLGVLVYLAAIDFRLGDLFILGRAQAGGYPKSFLQGLRDHGSYAWSAVTRTKLYILAFVFGSTCVVAAAAVFRPIAERRRVLSLVMPPVVVAVVYQLSIGFYGSNHSGYVIASQVTTLWAVSAFIAIMVAGIEERFGSLGRWVRITTRSATALAVLFSTASWARTPSLWEERSAGNVNFEDYIRQVTESLPERAAVWGSLYFGVDAGDRTDLVQFLQMFGVVQQDFRVEERPRLAPDFLLLSNYELDATTVQALDHQQSLIDTFTALFPKTRYRLARLVYAPPYGTTRIYERSTAADEGGQSDVTVSVNDGASRQWTGQLSAPLDVAFSPAEPVTANLLIYSLKPKRSSSSAIVGNLPPGMYVITVDIQRDNSDEAGEILATPGRYFFWRNAYSEYSVPSALYWRGQTKITMVVDHLGGALYISRFENKPAPADGEAPDLAASLYGIRKGPKGPVLAGFDGHTGIRVISTRRVLPLADNTGRLKQVEIPSPVAWTRLNSAVSVQGMDGGSVRIIGSVPPDSRLLQSAPVRLEANQRFILSLPTSPATGAVEVGVLDSNGSWLASPTMMPRRVVFETQHQTNATMVIMNSSPSLDVMVSPGTLMPVFPKELYVDRLMEHRRYGVKLAKPR